MSAPATPAGRRPAPCQAPIPDLSWFCCICCARRPMPHASFSMLLTTCSHIVCSSCWNRRGNGECPKCEAKANTLNLSAAKELPKQLEPYYKTPIELIKNLLATCEFQEYQKRQMLERRKVAWVLINHQRAKEDFEKEYTECKQMLAALNERKRAVKHAANNLRKRGIDPVRFLSGKVNACVLRTIGMSPSPSASAPSTPFLPTPLARPPFTSTPALPGANPPAVEFVEPKKLPHTMRGSVTSKAVRRSPSYPPTPVVKPPFTNPGNVLPVKRPRPASTPHLGLQKTRGHQPMMQLGQPTLQTGQPMQQSGHPVMQSGRLLTPAGRPMMQLGHSMSTRPPVMHAGRHIMNQSGQPILQPTQPRLHPGQQMVSSSIHAPPRIPSVQPIIPPRQPILISGQPTMQSGQAPTHTPQLQAAAGHSGGSVRIRAVAPSSVPQRIFPSPMSTRSSRSSHASPQLHTPSPMHLGRPTSSGAPTTTARVSLRPISAPHARPHIYAASQGPQQSPRRHVRTPTNPSPLLRAFSTTPHSSPWQQGRSSQGSGSPWKPGHTPPPGMRLSAGGAQYGSRGPRLTPMKS